MIGYSCFSGLSIDRAWASTPHTQPIFGAPAIVGEALEPCATESTVENPIVLSPDDGWFQTIKQAQSGTTLLLRGGIYQADDKVWMPAGSAAQPITLKPYNCEAVTLRTSLRPASHNIIAGLRIEATGISDIQWVIRIDGKNKGSIRNVIIRHNTLIGGERDALKVSADVADALISGNYIDGGKSQHVVNVQSEDQSNAPDRIIITKNRLAKSHFDNPSEDMLQVTDANHVEFSYNTCENGHRMEQCIDIKETRAPLQIHHNLFDGNTLHLDGPGDDPATGCMVIHERNTSPRDHLIEHNYFRNCRTTIIRFASEGGGTNSRATVRHNIFVSPAATDDDGLLIWRAEHVQFINNTMIRGTFKLGANDNPPKNPPRTPRATVIKNNIFYQTRMDDRTRPPEYTFECSHNLFFQISGTLNQAVCPNAQVADPNFTDLASENFVPLNTEAICGRGEGDDDIGGVACTVQAPHIVGVGTRVGPSPATSVQIVGLSETQRIGAATIEVTYDNALIQANACEADRQNLFDNAACTIDEDGVVLIEVNSTAGVAVDGMLAEITFTAEERQAGFVTISLQVVDALDEAERPLSIESSTVQLSLPGNPQLFIPLLQR